MNGKDSWFAARKMQLIQPGEVSDHFTYQVELVPVKKATHGYVVSNRVPTYDELVRRLRQKFPGAEPADLQKRAHKLVDHIFPTFLIRESAFLQLLQRDLPSPFKDRVPRALEVEKDSRGFVRRLMMNWLRIGGKPLSQLEFARQIAELLSILHDKARVMHLDLCLDNFVITERGVGFVDFGSAVRLEDENLNRSPMLNTLFEEMMRTSQIQRMLGTMLEKKLITNNVICDVHQKVDKTVDTFLPGGADQPAPRQPGPASIHPV